MTIEPAFLPCFLQSFGDLLFQNLPARILEQFVQLKALTEKVFSFYFK
jgi:hypothetical protein